MRYRHSQRLYKIQGNLIHEETGNKFFVWEFAPSKKSALKKLKIKYSQIKAPYKYISLTKKIA